MSCHDFLYFLLLYCHTVLQKVTIFICWNKNLIFIYFLVWIIHVHTANEQYAGTDANVYIRLFNPKHESTGEYQLTHSNSEPGPNGFRFRNLFEMGAVERFRIRTEDIGAVAKIEVSYFAVLRHRHCY